MANILTGEYEAVVQISSRQINGLLATLHQQGGVEEEALKLLHSAAVLIGDRRRRPPDVTNFGDWVIEYQKSGPALALSDIREFLAGSAPPGAARQLADAFAGFDDNWVVEQPPAVVRGLAKVQLSSVTVGVPAGSSTEVVVHAHIRAHYYPDPETTELPAPIHGEVRVTFVVQKAPGPSGTRLVIQQSPDDNKFQFIAAAGSGLNALQESLIAAEVRNALRGHFTLVPVDLPANFRFSEFKGLGSGGGQAIALPLQLSGAPPPPNGLQSVTNAFVGASGFAVAVSKEYVTGLVNLVEIRNAITQRTLRFFGQTYNLRFSSGPKLTFKNGAIEISGRVEVETDTWWAPNGFVRFKQAVTLILDTAAQTVRLEAAGDPDVDESLFIPHGTALNVVKTEIAKALSSNGPAVGKVFTDARSDLVNGWRSFDPSGSVAFNAVEITEDGIIARGEIAGAVRRAPVVEIAETEHGAAFTAFKSWIPGGRISAFTWSWIEYGGLVHSIWSGVEKSIVKEHHFILPKPSGITNASQICVQIEGSQISPGGIATPVAAGTVCHVQEPEFALDIPSWWEPLTLPVWLPDLSRAVVLREAIAGHLSVQTPPGQRELTQTTLIYFPDWNAENPLKRLREGLEMVRAERSPLVIAVLPAGAFDSRLEEVERRLASIGERFLPRLKIVEDDEGGWSRTFDVAKRPSLFLVNSRREFTWKHEGDPEPGALAEAVGQDAERRPSNGFQPLRAAVSVGDRAPDIMFEDERRNAFALHRLRGRQVLLNFWQSWSAPCMKELQRLKALQENAREAPVIVAFHGGKNPQAVDEARVQLKPSFPLVHDADQRIARQYGIRCWPSTISVDPVGHVEHIQLGIVREHRGRHVHGESAS